MKVFNTLPEHCPAEYTAVTIGKFDGLHRAHRMLIEKTVAAAKERGCASLVLSFDIAPQMILSAEEREDELRKMGVDILIAVPLCAAIISMSPEEFLGAVILEKFHARYIAVGEDFRFGYRRSGGPSEIRLFCETHGMEEEILPVIAEDGDKISSSRIRSALSGGDIAETNRLLGYPYYITGEIVHGRMLGRTIGMPTANSVPPRDKYLPRYGVYLTRTSIGPETLYGISDIGEKPTVGGQFPGIETNLFGWNGDLYGKKEKTELLRFLRPEKKFPSIDALKEQLAKDRKAAEICLAGLRKETEGKAAE